MVRVDWLPIKKRILRKVIVALYESTEGTILFQGRAISRGLSKTEFVHLRRAMRMFFQDLRFLVEPAQDC